MNDATKYLIIFILLLLLLLGAFFAGRSTVHPQIITKDSLVVRDKWDTISIPQDPVYITGKATSTTYTEVERDTVYQTRAFVDGRDTTIKGNYFRQTYAFPQREFSLYYQLHPDTIYTHTIDSSRVKYIKESPWNISIGLYLGTGWSPNSSLNGNFGIGIMAGYRLF